MFISLGLLDPNDDNLHIAREQQSTANESKKETLSTSSYLYCDGKVDDRLAQLRSVMKAFLKSSSSASNSSNSLGCITSAETSTINSSSDDTSVVDVFIICVENAAVDLRSDSDGSQPIDRALNLLAEGLS